MESTSLPIRMRNYLPIALRMAQQLLGNARAAADAVQAGFLKLYRAQASFQGMNLCACVLPILSNPCHDQISDGKRRSTMCFDQASKRMARSYQ